MDNILNNLEIILKNLSLLEKKGLDTSSLKVFIKNYKQFLNIYNPQSNITNKNSQEEKLLVVKSFLEDKKAFPYTKDIIAFANNRLNLDFKDQKVSRQTTINRILGRIKKNPELKDTLKNAVISIRNETVNNQSSSKTKNQIITTETFNKWAEIIKNI